jgi:hypothetical protein
MKKIIPICIAGILLCTAFGAAALPTDTQQIIPKNDTGKNDYTHTVFVEVGTATWCPSCPASNTAWHSIYESEDYDFQYTEMVIDKNTVANTRMQDDYNLYWVPTSYFDGGEYVYPGTSQGTFINDINLCGTRAVPDLSAAMNVLWLGSAQIQVDITINNNEATDYSGHLRVYIIELQSTKWKDYNGNWYYHAFLDFAFNEALTIPAGEALTDSTVWDGAAEGYPDISSENIQVILAVFNDTPVQAYSDPFHEGDDPTWAPFWAYYVDETIAATPQSNSAPYKPNTPTGPTTGIVNTEYTYSGNTTDPNGDDIYYLFDWGDGTDSGWLGPYASGETVQADHAWTFGGTYDVKLKAKDAVVDGPWSDPLSVQIAGPEIVIENVKGGLFKITAEIKNTWNEQIPNVNWNITLRSGVLIGKTTSGTNLTIPANGSATIQTGFIFGLGTTHIKIEAWIPDGPSTMVQYTGKIFLFFIKINT